MRERSNEIKEIINANDVKDMCGKHGLAVVRSCVDKGKERKKERNLTSVMQLGVFLRDAWRNGKRN